MKNFYSLFAVLTLVFAMCMTQGCAKKTQAVTTSPEVSIALSELRITPFKSRLMTLMRPLARYI